MADICPSITAFNAHDYRDQMDKVAPFAKRIHIDLMDGIFTPTTSPTLEQVWWPEDLAADIHLMHKQPMARLEQLKQLAPRLVIWHAEAEVDNEEFSRQLHLSGIKVGLALLATTSVESIFPLVSKLDHVLIFSGSLGRYGGQADLKLLAKAAKLKSLKPDIEIGWDGGINDVNAKALIDGGIDVLNVGGFIQLAQDPRDAYAKLLTVIS